MNLPSMQLLALHTYEELNFEKPHYVINALYAVFWAFVMNCENLLLILLNFHKLASFDDIINCKENGIVGRKLVRSAIPCRVFV